MLVTIFQEEDRNTISIFPPNTAANIDWGMICPVKIIALFLLDRQANLYKAQVLIIKIWYPINYDPGRWVAATFYSIIVIGRVILARILIQKILRIAI